MICQYIRRCLFSSAWLLAVGGLLVGAASLNAEAPASDDVESANLSEATDEAPIPQETKLDARAQEFALFMMIMVGGHSTPDPPPDKKKDGGGGGDPGGKDGGGGGPPENPEPTTLVLALSGASMLVFTELLRRRAALKRA